MVDLASAEAVELQGLWPVHSVLVEADAGIVVLADSLHLLAVDANGIAWESGDLSSDGLKDLSIAHGVVRGCGWDAPTGTWSKFALDCRTGKAV